MQGYNCNVRVVLRGYQLPAFVANAVYARDALGCSVVFASTLEANERMRSFCAKARMRLSGKRADHGLEWWVYEAKIDELDWPALTD